MNFLIILIFILIILHVIGINTYNKQENFALTDISAIKTDVQKP